MSNGEHALFSASASERWLHCPAALAMEKGIPNVSSKYADEGTAAHELAAKMLAVDGTFDAELIKHEAFPEVLKYVDMVISLSQGKELLVEQRVDYSSYIGIDNSFGTSDAIILDFENKEIVIVDLKYGRGVEVNAEKNTQLMLYALGAFNEFSLACDFEKVRMIIHQPRLNHVSEWTCTITELLAFSGHAKVSARAAMNAYAAQTTLDAGSFNPGEKQCRWCRAKHSCPALEKFVQDNIGGGFDDVSKEPVPQIIADSGLSLKMRAIPLIEAWCKAVRAEVERQLFDGKPVDGFKLVAGRAGKRTWSNEQDAETMLKSFRLKKEEMYNLSLISPTSAEKLLKDQPRRWDKVESLIMRKDAAPSVVPVTDKRPAYAVKPVLDGFDNLENNEGE